MRMTLKTLGLAAGLGFALAYPASFQQAYDDAREAAEAPIAAIAEGYAALEENLGKVWMRLGTAMIPPAHAAPASGVWQTAAVDLPRPRAGGHDGAHAAADLVRAGEGLTLEPFVWADGETRIGYGHGLAAHAISEDEAERLLAQDLAATAAAVRKIAGVPLKAHEVGALTALAHNIGLGALANSSVIAHLQAGDRAKAADAFLHWDKIRAGTDWVQSDALAQRRAAERARFLGRS